MNKKMQALNFSFQADLSDGGIKGDALLAIYRHRRFKWQPWPLLQTGYPPDRGRHPERQERLPRMGLERRVWR